MKIYDEFIINKRIYGFKKAIGLSLVEKILRPRWIVSEDGDLGIKVGGIKFFYYKWPDPTVEFFCNYRVMEKREFGEVIKSKGGQNG